MSYRFGGMPVRKKKSFRLLSALQREWMSILLTFVTLEIAVLSIERAKWLESQPSLTFVLILSVLTGALLVKRRFRRSLKWCLAVIGGLLVTAWQTLNVLPSSTLPWYEQLAEAMESFWTVVTMSGTDETSLHFVIFLVLFTWFLGYISTWYIIRKRNPWGVIVPGTIVILINLSNLPENYYGFLIFFLIASIFLAGQTKLVKNLSATAMTSIDTSFSITRFFASSVLSISILAAALTWFTPDINPGRITSIDPDETPVLENIEIFLTNFLSKVPRKQPQVSAENQGEYLFTGNYERSGDDIHFIIDSDSPRYWRTWVYDVYTSSGWKNSEVVEYRPEQVPLENGDTRLTGRQDISYSVEVGLKTDILLTAGQFLSADIPVSLHILGPPESVSPDEQIDSEKIIAAVSPYTLDPGRKYEVTSSIISAAPYELAAAGENYTAYIAEHYLQLPDNLPERIRELSANITANATTPYEKALAISENLSLFSYSLKTPPPPEGTDAVDFFCFSEQSGACGDFATAMVVLLRSAGVPARFCTGYRYGEPDSDSGKYYVLESYRHAWAEVYFPGYGWVEFESTPGSSTPIGLVGVEAFTGGGTTEVWDTWRYMQEFDTPSPGFSPSSYATPSAPLDTTSVVLIWPFVFLGIGIPVALIIYFVYFRRERNRNESGSSGTEYESEVYAGMCELAAQAHIGPLPYQTPLEFCTQLISELPRQSDSINTILQAFMERRYGPESDSGQGEEMNWRLLKARRSVFDAIRERLPQPAR